MQKTHYTICLISQAMGLDNSKLSGGVWSQFQIAVAELLSKFVTYHCWFTPPTTQPPLFLDPELNCFPPLFWPSRFPSMCLQAWQSGRLGSTSTILEGMEIMSVWKRFVFITGREFVRGPWPWRLALQTGLQRQTLEKLSTPVWRRVSGASTRNSPMAVSAPTTMSASSVHQVALLLSQSCTSHIAGTYEHSA